MESIECNAVQPSLDERRKFGTDKLIVMLIREHGSALVKWWNLADPSQCDASVCHVRNLDEARRLASRLGLDGILL